MLRDEMEQDEGIGGGSSRWSGGVEEYCYWGGASLAQLFWAISSFRRGYTGDSRLMPFKAFAVASLFLGCASTATMGSLRASGIHSGSVLLLMGHDLEMKVLPFRRWEQGYDGGIQGCRLRISGGCVSCCKVDDMKALGANIRTGLGIRPRSQDE